jgi:asparagine synthase (glutamine-hydrolysing)
MKAVRFAFAVPHRIEQRPALPGKLVSSPAQICTDQLQLWKSADTPYIALGEAGWLIGLLFGAGSSKRIKTLLPRASESESARALAEWLIRHYWGAYVALLVDRSGSGWHILVDPSGLLPVYHRQTHTHHVIATHPALFEEACDLRPSPSWSGLRAHLARSNLRQRKTCLRGIEELTPGELVSLRDPLRMRSALWRPEPFMPRNAAISLEEAAAGLRNLATKVIGAWGEAMGPATVAASGGVDSSLLCAALINAGQPSACITVSTNDPAGDESRFVQLLADRFGVRSVATRFDEADIDPLVCVSKGLARPSRKSFMAALDAALLRATDHLAAKVIFDGNGGDNLFCFLHSAAPIADRLMCEGPGRGVVTTFLDMCRITGCDVPTMARALMRRLFGRHAANTWTADLRLLSDRLDELDDYEPLTPWSDARVSLHRGKRDHLNLIMKNQHHVNGLGAGGLPRFSPLMSQPLVEYCLAVPTWIWSAGGINRAPARAAFAAELPDAIVRRTSKAGPDSFLRQFFEKHRRVYRELLLDGLLVSHDLLDRAAVDAALSTDANSQGSIIYRLLDLVEAENWARSWHR